MLFTYTALNGDGERIQESLEAASMPDAQQELLRRGLFVLNLEQSRSRRTPTATEHDGETLHLGGSREEPTPHRRSRPSARMHELALFTRQMSMMLRAGASIVPAIRAINDQPGRAAWHALLSDLAEQKDARPIGVSAASVPPVTITSLRPARILVNASPIA